MPAMTYLRTAVLAAITCGLLWAVPALAQGADAPRDATVAAPARATASPPRPRIIFRPPPPSRRLAFIATFHRPVVVRVAPKPGARRRTVLRPIAPFAGDNTQLLVTRSVVRGGVLWIEVLLPLRPNGVRGWVTGDDVTLRATPFRVEVSLSQRRLTVFRAGRPVWRVPVAVGKNGTPTPTGRFAVAETVRTNQPRGFLGPRVLPLTGYSRVLNEFAGGDGRVAMHGTSLPRLIGSAASNGCVRMRNRDVVRLSRMAKPGTPVLIRR